jgi:nucleotide-binding universal stress UspA family protein
MFPISNILYPINLNSKNISTVTRALEIAQFYKSTIHILYVNDPGASHWYPADHEDAVALKVKEVVPAEVIEKSSITYAVAKGDLAGEIAAYCTNNRIDLIIAGHKRRSKLYSILFDSPDVNIIDTIPVPVLVIPKN